MSDTTIWITGATEGIGAGLAETAPYPGARIINLSRRKHPVYESVLIDLTDPATWPRVEQHLQSELANFKGRRAIFIQNGYWSDGHGVLEQVSADTYLKSLYANLTAPLALGAMFLRAVKPGYEAGIALISAGAAACCLEGLSTYGPGKIALEHWAQIVDKELGNRPGRPWVAAVRAGGTLTGPVKRMIENLDPKMPNAQHIRDNAKRRLDPVSAARQIWANLPPPPGVSLISFGDPPDEYRFEGAQVKKVNVPGWQLMYR